MGRNSTKTEYGYDAMSIDDILSEFGVNGDFSDPAEQYEDIPDISLKRDADDSVFDSRFNIGGKIREDDTPKDYGGLDLSADENYVPPAGSVQKKKKRPKDTELFEADAEYPEKDVKDVKKGKKKKKKKAPSYQPEYQTNEIEEDEEFASKFRSLSEDADDGFDSEVTASEEKAQGYFPPSFSEYLASILPPSILNCVASTVRM